jgi:hypothetical protein
VRLEPSVILTLPWIVILAALLYLVASRAGWLDSLAQWNRRPRKPVIRRALPPTAERDASPRRLEVFEEFLRNLGRDDTEDS